VFVRGLRTLLLSVSGLLVALPASAQATLGVRGGVAADPKQGLLGFHVEEAALSPHDDLTFRPGVEVGFGSGETIVSGSLEVAYWVTLSNKWRTYLGAGPAAVFVHTSGACTGCAGGGNAVHGVFNGFVGFQNDAGVFIEVKGSGGTNASLHLTAGFLIKRKK
jgi:hypothetical protein